jgi:3-oxoadipate enol-lactonase
MPIASLSGCDLYYEAHGPDDAPVVVFAHGAGGNHLSWWQQVPHFMDRYRCITFDHRAYGQSVDRDGSGGAGYPSDLAGLLDHLRVATATLVAQSMGGWTCLNFAVASPGRVERLVMADTHGGLRSAEVGAAMKAAHLAAPPTPPPGVHIAAGPAMAREQPALAFLYGQIDALNPPRDPEGLGRHLASIGEPSAEAVASLAFPVLFIVGEEDPLIPPPVIEAAAACFRLARAVRVPAAGHSVYFERAAHFNELVADFLRES